MRTTLKTHSGAIQGLVLIGAVTCVGGFMGYVQAGRQLAELSSSAVAVSGLQPASAAATSAQATDSSRPPNTAASDSALTVSDLAAEEFRAAQGAWTKTPGATPNDTNLAPAWPFWEFKLKEPVPPRDPPLTPLNWRLIGAVQGGDGWQVVILRQGNPVPEFFRVGQTLPGGYLIEAISEEDVTLVHRRRRMIVAYIGS